MNIESLLTRVNRPSRYCGNEGNRVKKNWQDAALRVALVFPDMYEIGMSHQGLQILYHIINSQPEYLAERAYSPDLDLEKLLGEEGLPLFSLESKRPLGEFDLLGITLPYELCYTNILTILGASHIPLYAAERDQSHPLVIGGGPGAFQPEPVAEFFDAILLGDGEEGVLDILAVVRKLKEEGVGRGAILDALAGIDGVYVPSHFSPQYAEDGRLSAIVLLREAEKTVRRRVLPELPNASFIAPLVPLTKIVHDRLGLEIARGCTRGCRFCQAGIIYRPVRERSPMDILKAALDGIDKGGFEEMALLSLSTGDYSCLNPLLATLMDTFSRQQVSVSMPSMRVGTLTPEIMAQIKRVRKTGFTLAPEAGSERLRQVINKGISEADLLATCRAASELGWRQLKLYFMFGLPTETEDDMVAMVDLAKKASQQAGGRATIAVSAATFVPKAHTSFQWEPQLTIEEGFSRIDFLKGRLRGRQFKLKWHDPRLSFLEGVFSRGDRRLAPVIVQAWRDGARFDAWTDHFNLPLWQRAAEKCGIDFAWYLRRRDFDEVLPWQHLDPGVDAAFLRTELARAHSLDYTPDCRVHGCQGCGLCDFKRVKPVVQAKGPQDEKRLLGELAAIATIAPTSVVAEQGCKFVYRLVYEKRDEARFLSHLEMLQIFYRAFRAARLPLRFSQGFHPVPQVSFGPALPLGTASHAELLSFELVAPLSGVDRLVKTVNTYLPAGLVITQATLDPRPLPQDIICQYMITTKEPMHSEQVERFLAASEIMLAQTRKGRIRHLDIRPLVHAAQLIGDCQLALEIVSRPSVPTVKPREVLIEMFGKEFPADIAEVVKIGWQPFTG